MAVSTDKLTNIDYEILSYISRFGSVSREEIIKYFPNVESVDYRLEYLSQPEYHHSTSGISFPLENTSYIEKEYDAIKKTNGSTIHASRDFYHISALGKKALQDYSHEKQRVFRRTLWTEIRLWLALLISAIALIRTLLS